MRIEERREGPAEGAGEMAVETAGVGWTVALEEQFGSAPWWLVSAALHMLVILALGLVMVSRPPIHATEVIQTAWTPPIENPPPPVTRKPIDNPQTHDFKEPAVDEFTLVLREEPDIPEDEFLTDNNSEDNSARGQKDAISDVPLAHTGVVANLGLHGMPAGAFGLDGRDGRKRKARGRIGDPRGPKTTTFETVNRALEWLARHQEPDGHWEGERFGGKNTDAGITGLATLAFLGNGDTERHGKYQKNVFRAVTWLIRQQRPDGSIGHGYEGGLGYHHAIAGLALAEAYGMGKLKRTRAAAQKAINYSTAQHQSEYSGWRYKPRTPADMSVTGWFVMQLKSAKMAELAVDGSGLQGAVAFLDKCTHSRGKYDGLVSYQPGRGPTPTMTAVGAVSRLFMNFKPNDPLVTGATHNLVENLPDWEGGYVNFYYWYYGTLAMFQVGGDGWKAWNPAMRDMLEERQRRGAPDVDGSWDPVGQWCGRGGRVYSTAMGALCLEIYWRYGLMHR